MAINHPFSRPTGPSDAKTTPSAKPGPHTARAEEPVIEAPPVVPWLAQQGPFVIAQRSTASMGPAGVAPPRQAPPANSPRSSGVGASGAFTGKLIHTPVCRLRHPETGSLATIVGNIHAGQPEYYQRLKEMLTALEQQGTMIHYERVRPPTEAELAAVSDETRVLHKRFVASRNDARVPHEIAGLVNKRDVFTPGERWQRHDISTLETVEFYGPHDTQAWIEANRQKKQLVHAEPDAVRSMLLTSMVETSRKLRSGARRTEMATGAQLKLAIYREMVAMAAVDVHLALNPATDIALFWGCAHTPGFRAAFEARGFHLEDKQWITAINSTTLGT